MVKYRTDYKGQDLSQLSKERVLAMGEDLEFMDGNFTRANLSGLTLAGFDLDGCDLRDANLSNVDFTNADLTGARLMGAKLDGVKGLATKEEEMREAQRILDILEIPGNHLEMEGWHTCKTTHCIAGWHRPDLGYPGRVASTAMPTLAKYFFEDNETALAALKRVASGEESIWN